MGPRQCGGIDDRTINHDEMGQFHNAVKGASIGPIPKEARGKSFRRIGQNEAGNPEHGMGVHEGKDDNRVENYKKIIEVLTIDREMNNKAALIETQTQGE